MNDNQRIRLRMYRAVRAYLTSHAEVWNGVAALVAMHVKLGVLIEVIESRTTAQGAGLKGQPAVVLCW